jgi:hypothetical protein
MSCACDLIIRGVDSDELRREESADFSPIHRVNASG